MSIRQLVLFLALLGSSLSVPVKQDVSGSHVALAPRAINPIYLDAARAEWGGPESLKQRDVYEGDDWSSFNVPGARDIYEGDDWSDFAVPGAKRAIREIKEVHVETDWSTFEAPSAINPIYLNVSHDALYRRAESGPLYGNGGAPVIGDVHQTTNPSCGFASVLAAVVNVKPAWISTHLDHTGDVSDISKVTVNMYDPTSFAARSFDITCAETASKSDVDPATGIWWPGAYDHAGVKLGLDNSNGAMGPILPITSLQAITGLKGASEDKLTADRLFELAQTAKSRNTPMILQTNNDGAKTLVGGHAYALLDGTGSGNDRKIVLFNPWGSHVTVSVDSVVGETYCVWRLRDYNTYTGGGANNQQEEEDPAPPETEVRSTTTQQEGGDVQPTTIRQVDGEGQSTSIRQIETEASSTSARQRGKWGNADLQPTTVRRGGDRVNAVQPTVMANTKPKDGVVWVTEVVTVNVHV